MHNYKILLAREMGTISKINLRGITLGISPLWRIKSFNFYAVLFKMNDFVYFFPSSVLKQKPLMA